MRSTILTLTLLIGIMTLCGCQSLAWMTKKQLPDYKPDIQVQQQWRGSTGYGSGGYYLHLKPAIARDVLYAANFSGQMKAIDLQTGDIKWRTTLDNNLTSGVAQSRHFIYVGSEDGDIYALKQDSGEVVWKKKLSNEILATPYFHKGKLFVKCEDGTIYALKAVNGKRLWSHQEKMPSLVLRGSSSAQAKGRRVFAGFANGKLMAFAISTGQILWQQAIGKPEGDSAIDQMVDVEAQPVIAGNTIYAVSYHGYLAAMDINTGRVRWRQKLSSFSGITVQGDRIYVSDEKGRILAFNRHSGHKIWVQDRLKGRELTRPSVINQHVVVADYSGYVHWLATSNGQLVGRYYVGGEGVLARPSPYGNSLVVLTQSGYLYRLKPRPIREKSRDND